MLEVGVVIDDGVYKVGQTAITTILALGQMTNLVTQGLAQMPH